MPTFSLVMTINERPVEVLEKVFASIPPHDVGQLVIVFDRTPKALKEAVTELAYQRGYEEFLDEPADGYRDLTIVEIEGKPGWVTGIRSWNEGFKAITSEYAICFSSEVIFNPGSFDAMKKRLSGQPCVVYGKCEDSGELGPVTNNPENPMLLCSSAYPRPLGFIYGAPTWALREMNGFDPRFQDGFWYDDDDFCMRLWSLGLPFVFADDVSGIHQAHTRKVLDTPEGQAGIERNKKIMLSKWGCERPWDAASKLWANGEGVTVAVPKNIELLHQNWGKLCQ